MRFRLALTLSLSLLLIGAASWSRFHKEKEVAELVAINQQVAAEYQEKLIENAINATTTATITPQEELTGTDLVGRQLIMDYLSLASAGAVTEESLMNLAERYVESIPTLSVAKTISPLELRVVNNGQANLERYATEMTAIHRKYALEMRRLEPETQNLEDSSTNYAFAGKAHLIYADTAEKMSALSVPAMVAEMHVKLVNVYMANAASMQALSQAESDSASAFAGLIKLSENTEAEVYLLDEIGKTLEKHGI